MKTEIGVEREFTALHLDPFRRDNPHEHLWSITVWQDTTDRPRDVRALGAALDELLRASFQGQMLDSFLSPATAENIGSTIARLLSCHRYRCGRPLGQTGGGEWAEGEP